MPITISYKGSFSKTEKSLTLLKNRAQFDDFDHYGRLGVDILSRATPKETGETANSWYYEIVRGKGYYIIQWSNRHTINGVNIAAIIQYGHGTGTGGWVSGIDYINPAMRPLFEQIVNDMWRKVTSGYSVVSKL